MPLRFFHFSGFKPTLEGGLSIHDPNPVTKQILADSNELFDLIKDYAKDLYRNGLEEFSAKKNHYQCFSDGKPISKELRVYFRKNKEQLQPILPKDSNPFDSSRELTAISIAEDPSIGISHAMYSIWHFRKDLQEAFPDPLSRDSLEFLNWFEKQAPGHSNTDLLRYVTESTSKLTEATGKSDTDEQRLGKQRIGLKRLGNALSSASRKGLSLAENVKSRLRAADEGLGVNLIGYELMPTGVGQALRSCIETLRDSGVPHVVIDVSDSSRRFSKEKCSLPYDTNLFFVNADSIDSVLEQLHDLGWSEKYNIAYWHWELEKLPKWMRSADKNLDEIWTSSKFSADAIARFSEKPVLVVPHAIIIPEQTKSRRERFSLPDDLFLFLVMFDAQSFYERKNPYAAIAAFAELQKSRSDIGLVLKISHSHSHWNLKALISLEESVKDLRNCYIITDTLSRQEVYDLQASCDCLVSLHRAEGFGLCLAECMALGKPVVVTNWSGNVDFTSSETAYLVDFEIEKLAENVGPYKAGQRWANPCSTHASELMSRVVSDSTFREEISANAKDIISEKYGRSVVADSYRERLKVRRTP